MNEHGVTLSRDVTTLCLEVAWEVDALARTLPGLVPSTDAACDPHFVARCIGGRLLRLSSLLMAALDGEPVEELRGIIDFQQGQG